MPNKIIAELDTNPMLIRGIYKHYLNIAMVVMGSVAAGFFGDGIRALTGAETTVTVAFVEPESVPLDKTGARTPYESYLHIRSRDLFQTASLPAPAVVKPKIDLTAMKRTRLRLRLWGTIVSDEEHLAIIEVRTGGEQQLYRVGDTIDNAVISLILKEQVVLKVDGKSELLELESFDQKPVPTGDPGRRQRLPAPGGKPLRQAPPAKLMTTTT